MNGIEPIPPRDEAELWFARRRDPARRAATEPEFWRWSADPANKRAYSETERLWNQLGQLNASTRLMELADAEDGRLPAVAEGAALTRLTKASGSERSWRFLKPLALAACAAPIVLYFFTAGNNPPARTYATGIGEQRTETLLDGTEVILNTRTIIDVRYTRKRREITLRSGEAIFDVTPDLNKPFVVNAGNGSVTVLGTRFQVRHDTRKVAVTLIEGAVRVARLDQRGSHVLVPGQQATYSADANGITTQNVDVALGQSWAHGRLEFRSTPLSEAVAEANRYSTIKLRLGDPALADMPVSGSFRTGDVPTLAAGLGAAYLIRPQYGKGEIVLLPARAR